MNKNKKTYCIIYADPPWYFGDRYFSGGRRKKLKYPTMKIEELKKIKVKDICKKNCVLFMWTTDAHIPEAIEVMKTWGFRYVTVAFVWLKKTKNNKNCCIVSNWTIKSSELCLLGVKGRPHKFLKRRDIRQLIEAERGEHSQKPNEVRRRIVQMFGDVPRIELFAREKKEGFDVWGNEVVSDVEI